MTPISCPPFVTPPIGRAVDFFLSFYSAESITLHPHSRTEEASWPLDWPTGRTERQLQMCAANHLQG